MSLSEKLLATPPITLRRVMDHLGQDVEFLCDLSSDFGLVDEMLSEQEPEHLRELAEYLGPLLAQEDVTEEQLATLIGRCGGEVFERTARESLSKLYARARDRIDASYRRGGNV